MTKNRSEKLSVSMRFLHGLQTPQSKKFMNFVMTNK